MFLHACVILSTLSGGGGVGYLWSHVLSVGVGYHWFHGPSGGGVGYLGDRVSRGVYTWIYMHCISSKAVG